MTIERAPSTNGRVHADETPREATYTAPEAGEAPEAARSGSLGRLLLPLALVVLGVVILRRLNRGSII